MAVTLRGDRGAFGGGLTPPQAGPLRLGPLSARAAGAALLGVDANGDVVAGALVAADLPAVFTRRDVAEVIGASWTWAAGQTITFAAGGPLAAPQLSTRSPGTRLILEPVPGSTEYALGRDVNTQWASVPAGKLHQWYQGATERLRLDSDGTLKVLNGSGALHLDAAGTGLGNIVATGSLQFAAFGGDMVFHTFSGQINPNAGYRENLGRIDRKYLTLHCAELWAETLVAQDTLATIGGRILVGPTTTLTRDVAVGDTAIYVKHNFFGLFDPATEYGSKLVLQVGGQFEVMQVAAITRPVITAEGDYRYDVLRNTDGSSATKWFAGDAVFDTGKVTGGPVGAFIDLYSVRGLKGGTTAGPTIVGNVRTGGEPTGWREHWAIGNLQGVYGNASTRFGAAFGDTNGVHVQVDSTDGFTIRGGGGAGGAMLGQWSMANVITLGYGGASQISIDPNDGTLRMKYAGGDRIVLHSDGTLRVATEIILGGWTTGMTALRSYYAGTFNSGAGFYFGYNSATTVATALIGNSAGRRLQWDGADLKVVTDGLTIDQNGLTMLQNGGTTATPGRLIRFGTTGLYLWDTTSGGGEGMLVRQTGNLSMVAVNGAAYLRAGGTASSGVPESAHVLVRSTHVELGGGAVNGPIPFWPSADVVHEFGGVGRRWLNVFSYRIGLALPGVPIYQIELGSDAAYKTVSSTWTTPSDGRAKRDVTPVDASAALALVRRVALVRFVYTGDFGTPKDAAGIGVIAEDLAPILPQSVARRSDNGAWTWNAHELFTLNVAAVQALAARVDALERTRS